MLQLKAEGLSWKRINERFPSKSSNACRKHCERLLENRKNAGDWSLEKLEPIAREYVLKRKEIWTMLAAGTGENWRTAENKVSYQSTLHAFSSRLSYEACIAPQLLIDRAVLGEGREEPGLSRQSRSSEGQDRYQQRRQRSRPI